MKKDLDKILSRTLITYTFLLLLIFILKLIGLDYFGLNVDNPVLIMIDKVATKYHLVNIYYCITLYIYTYMYVSICCKDNSKRSKLYVLACIPVIIAIKIIAERVHSTYFSFFMDFSYIFITTYLYNDLFKLKNKKLYIEIIIFILINSSYQILSVLLRNINYQDNNHFIVNVILDFDYIMCLFITQYLLLKKEGKTLCGMVVYLFSGLQISLKNLLKRFQTKSLSKNKIEKKNKKELFEYRLYVILFLLWNIFTVFIVLMIAKINNAFIECVIILCAFWFNKTVFGKAFHMNNAKSCFIVSNLAYLGLVRLTVSVGISLMVPIVLGILLSYCTSLLVKYKEVELYRGMPQSELEDICRLHKLTKYETKLLIDFYCNKISDVKLAMMNNYSVDNIKKQKKVARDKIKNLKNKKGK